WGKAQAKRYLDAIANTLAQIAAMPLAGSDQTSVPSGLRKWPSGSHNIYYRMLDDVVPIVRVIQERMDVACVRMTLQSPATRYRPES
ncbi:type II toxin-antitoxin system RelE/ParE family toxin, partial [Sphingomonas sp.]|uniref:type II toxin-antitoxin system RelE/ParE family toxin n=1 Tax=Sphingomonas sp. TaxID=28214 RepID=UPI0031DC99FD